MLGVDFPLGKACKSLDLKIILNTMNLNRADYLKLSSILLRYNIPLDSIFQYQFSIVNSAQGSYFFSFDTITIR